MHRRFARLAKLLELALLCILIVLDAHAALAAACPDCAAIAAELDAARTQQAGLEHSPERRALARDKQRGRVDGELAQNAGLQADIDRRRGEIDRDIERQRDTFASTDTSGATVRSEYDLATGERVTTRTPPGGPTTETGREASAWLQKLLAEKSALDQRDTNLDKQRADLEKRQAEIASELPGVTQRVADLARQLDECLKARCPGKTSPDQSSVGQSGGGGSQPLELVVDRAEVMEFRVPAGQDAHAITEGISGATLFPIPTGAGGGFQVAVPVPTDKAGADALKQRLNQLAEAGSISDLQATPCRKFLPEGTSVAPGTTPPRTQRSAQIIKGTARTGTGVELGQAVVLLVPPPVVAGPNGEVEAPTEPQQPGGGIDTPLGWIPGTDDQPPAIGIPDPNGDFVIVVPEGYTGPQTIMLAPICNCTTTTRTRDGTTETVSVGQAEVTAPPTSARDSGTPTSQPQDEPCYCGPDITAALTGAINRAQQRIDALPSSETGPYDGFEFLYNNADAFDAPVAPVTDPTLDPATLADPKAAWLCPSGICARMGQVPFMLGGFCLPKHMSNEILAAFVASGVGVPITVFSAGANVKEVLNYGSIEGDAPFIAYIIGYQLQSKLSDLGSLTEPQAQKVVSDVLETSLFGYFQNYREITEEYPGLEQCQDCPYESPGRFTKDFTTKPWKLADGTPVGGDTQSPSADSEAPPPASQTKPQLKKDAAPAKDCDAGSGAAATGAGR